MDAEKEKTYRTYAWAYFSYHADQRMKTFNFFIILAGLISGGMITLLKDHGSPWIITPLGLSLSYLCLLFFRLDQRNHTLVRNGEAAIKYLDALDKLDSDEGAPNVLSIFDRDDYMRDDYMRKGKSRSIFCFCGYFSYSQVIRRVYGLFFLLGIFFAIFPFKSYVKVIISVNDTTSSIAECRNCLDLKPRGTLFKDSQYGGANVQRDKSVAVSSSPCSQLDDKIKETDFDSSLFE